MAGVSGGPKLKSMCVSLVLVGARGRVPDQQVHMAQLSAVIEAVGPESHIGGRDAVVVRPAKARAGIAVYFAVVAPDAALGVKAVEVGAGPVRAGAAADHDLLVRPGVDFGDADLRRPLVVLVTGWQAKAPAPAQSGPTRYQRTRP